MKKIFALCLFLAALGTVQAQTHINPAYQIDWPRVTGIGAPTGPCVTLSYGQPYTDLDANVFYVCGPTGWQTYGGSSSGVAGGDLSGSFPNPTVTQVNGAPLPISAGLVGTDSGGTIVQTAATSPTLPATCNIGDFWSGDPSGGLNAIAYGCVALNTWRPYAMTRQMGGYCNGVANASTTLTLPNLGAPSATGSCSASVTAGLGTRMMNAGQLLGLGVSCATAGVASGSGVFTVFIQPSGSTSINSTGLTVTMGTSAANTFKTDTTPAVPFNAGDIISVHFTTQAAETLGTCGVVISYV